jgi:putative tryptophan/tyrosine transport system substrate-binding protein
MKRRAFITLVGGTVIAWPLAARAQQRLPVVGYLAATSSADTTFNLVPFLEGLKQAGFVEGAAPSR